MQNAWLSEVRDSLNRGRFDMGDETKDKEAPAALRVKIKLGDAVIGPGKIMLLGLLEEEGGISAAARRLGLTYRRAWYLIDTVNQATGRAAESAAAGYGTPPHGIANEDVSAVGRKDKASHLPLVANVER